MDQAVTDAAEHFVLKSLTRLFSDLMALKDFDEEDYPPIQSEATMAAFVVTLMAAGRCALEGVPWQGPTLAPNDCGGVELTWRATAGALLLIFKGDGSVVCVARKCGEKPVRNEISPWEAPAYILSVLRRQ